MSYMPPNLGSTSFSGVALTTSYVVTHGLSYTPSKVFVMPRSLNASALCYISSINSTTFTISFVAVPVVGVNNISFDWIAFQ